MYRLIAGNSLAIFLVVFLTCPLFAADQPLTRLELAEKASLVLLNRPLDEAQALNSGLLHPYPDGRIHLDWPATRGAAAVVLEKLSRERGDQPQPGFFPDVPPDSPLAAALAQVGKIFLPESDDRFRPEKLLTGPELVLLLKAYQEALENPFPSTLATCSLQPQVGTFIKGQSFPNDFQFSRPSVGTDSGKDSTMPGQVNRLGTVVPADQWSPQGAFNLVEAQDGVSEIEKSLDQLEVTVFDLSSITDATAEEEQRIREALSSIQQVIRDSLGKMAFARRQMKAVCLSDPAMLRQAGDFQKRLDTDTLRLERVGKRLSERLQTQSPSEKTP